MYRSVQSLGAADHEREVADPLVAPEAEQIRERGARKRLAALVEGDDARALGRRAEQQL